MTTACSGIPGTLNSEEGTSSQDLACAKPSAFQVPGVQEVVPMPPTVTFVKK